MGADETGGIPSVDEMSIRIAARQQIIEEDEEYRQELLEGKPSGNPIQLGPRLPSPEKWAKEQVDGAKAKGPKWLENTTRPKKNFKEEALRDTAVERYKVSMQKVIDEDRHKGGMELVDESETMAIIKARGAAAYTKGVEDRRVKIERRVKELHPARLALAAEIDELPVSTDAEREEKMIQNKRGLQAIGAERRGGG